MPRSTSMGRLIRIVFFAGFLFGIFTSRGFSWNAPDEANVNSRYTVESVELSGASEAKLSKSLREELRRSVGQRFSPEAFAKLSGRVREELRARLVSPKLTRGSSPESVRVVLSVMGRNVQVNGDQSRFAWHTRQGFTGVLNLNIVERDGPRLSLGIFSDGDTATERQAGVRGQYAHSFWHGRVEPFVAVATSHAQYDARTLEAAGTNDLYRSVDTIHSGVTIVPWRGDDREELTLHSGLRWQRFELLSPGPDRVVASRALVHSLRYRRVRGDVGNGRVVMTASGGLVNGLRAAGSDYAFTRTEIKGGFEYHRGSDRVTVDAVGGRVQGAAPFTDRFAAGNTTVLRGWNKFEIAPAGTDRLIASAVEYGRSLKGKLEGAVFFDTGAAWNRGHAVVARNSAGCGIRTRDGFFLYVAFPFREGRLEPMLMTGATF